MRVLINRTDALGDTLLTLPLAEAFKKFFPESKVAFLVKSSSLPLLQNNSFVDEVMVLEGEWKEACSAFAPDIYMHIHGDKAPLIWAFKQGIRKRIGVRSKWYSWVLLNQGIRQKRSLGEKHETQYNLDLLQTLGIEQKSLRKESFKPRIYLNEIEKEFSRDFWQQYPSGRKVIVHPGMTGHSLNWPLEFYGELIDLLQKEGHQVYLSHTPVDKIYIEKVKSFIKGPVQEIQGQELGLRNYLAVLSQADLVIAPSTGPLHMAAALERPCIGLYSPLKVQSVKRWGPLGDPHKSFTFSPEIEDEKLLNTIKRVGNSHPCMQKISVSDVFLCAQKILA